MLESIASLTHGFFEVQAALGAATNEFTLAAVNLNFDFTLWKTEAPKEYQELGQVLSGLNVDLCILP
jgi:hypothetical protein